MVLLGLANLLFHRAQSLLQTWAFCARHVPDLIPTVQDLPQSGASGLVVLHRQDGFGLLHQGHFLGVVLFFRFVTLGIHGPPCIEELVLGGAKFLPQFVVLVPSGAGRGFPLIHEVSVGSSRRTPIRGICQGCRPANQVLLDPHGVFAFFVEFGEVLPAGLVKDGSGLAEAIPKALLGRTIKSGQLLPLLQQFAVFFASDFPLLRVLKLFGFLSNLGPLFGG